MTAPASPGNRAPGLVRLPFMNDAHFLQTIIEHPDDEAPRLVYADWLEHRQPVRAALIRIQCELARLPEYNLRRDDQSWTNCFAKPRTLRNGHQRHEEGELSLEIVDEPLIGCDEWTLLVVGQDNIHAVVQASAGL